MLVIARQKALFNITVERELERAKSLSIQGLFLGMEDTQLKSSHSCLLQLEFR